MALLEKKGYRGGRGGQRGKRRWKSLPRVDYRLVLMDVQMPVAGWVGGDAANSRLLAVEGAADCGHDGARYERGP